MNMPIWLLVILAMVCIITGYFCGVINTRDDAKDTVLQRSSLDQRIITCFQRLCDMAGIEPYTGVSKLSGLCEAVEGLRPGATTYADVPPLDKGHALLFSGKTVLHRGLNVDAGTRNILVYWCEYRAECRS